MEAAEKLRRAVNEQEFMLSIRSPYVGAGYGHGELLAGVSGGCVLYLPLQLCDGGDVESEEVWLDGVRAATPAHAALEVVESVDAGAAAESVDRWASSVAVSGSLALRPDFAHHVKRFCESAVGGP